MIRRERFVLRLVRGAHQRWPAPRPEPEREPVHPRAIPDDTPGPFAPAEEEER